MTQGLEDSTVGAIVAGDFRYASVFERFGIDFCCGGQRSLDEACRSARVDRGELIRALEALPADAAAADEVADWPLDRLIDHIVASHHSYVRRALPAIAGYLVRLQNAHGARHPELRTVAALFDRLGAELEQHMLKEERVLFPYVRDVAEHAGRSCGVLRSPFGTVSNPIRMMEQEHRDAAEALQTIRDLTDGFTPPADGCTTYAVCMSELARFERDLHRHVHLENNVLFPRAIALEGSQTGVA